MPYVPIEVFANNATTTVTSGGTSAPPAGTVETWTVASSSSLPPIEYGAQQCHIADTAFGFTTETITVLNIAGTTLTVKRGADGTTPVAHTANFTIVQVVSSGWFTSPTGVAPWQFNVERYGAQGDGVMRADGTGTSGSATFTSASSNFVNAVAPLGDVGKVLIINQGANGSATNPWVGSILAVNSPTSLTLSSSLTANAANAPFVYGTDDTSAINAAISAALTFAQAYNYKAQVLFEPLNYMIGAAPVQTTTPIQQNTQIPVPYGTQFGQKPVIDLIGVGDASEPDYWETEVPSLQGTCLISTQWVSGINGTYGQQSVIGGPTATTGLSPGNFANSLLQISGITIVCPWNSSQMGVDGRYLGQMNTPNASYLAFAPVNYPGASVGGPWLSATNLVTNGNSVGFYFPLTSNNDNCNAGLLTAEGAAFGVAFSEHFTAQRLALIYCATCMYYNGGTGAPNNNHGFSILYVSCEASGTGLQVNGTGMGFIASLDCEVVTTNISDTNNYLNGKIYVFNLSSSTITVTGGLNCQIVNCGQTVGVWSGAPAAPASGTAQTNTSWRMAYVSVTSTASITAAAVDGTSVFSGSVPAGYPVVIPVPGGHTYTITSAGGTLTTHWILE